MGAYYDIVIVGAGASGLLSACLLACSGKRILLLEKEDRVGRKLSATGNGRCNLTNLSMDWKHYYGDREFVTSVLDRVPPSEVIRVFEELGVLTREKDGYVYPHSNQAATVVGALYRGCRKPNVTVELGARVTGVAGQFSVETPEQVYECETLMLATGGPAGAEQGGCDDGYDFLRALGHTVTPVLPGLTGLYAAGRFWKGVAGTRVQGSFTLFIDGKRQGTETGEIQITKDGVSGIPVFQLCRLAAEGLAENKPVWGEIDFVPSLSMDELTHWVEINGFEGVIPTKWISIIGNGQKSTEQIAKTLKHFSFTITDTYGMERAQVSAGGVPVEEISRDSFESLRCPGLYVLGELVNIDGMCGGYNLHLAWASAILASESILKTIGEFSD